MKAQTDIAATDIFAKAVSQNRPVLLVFSGSDWCQPCIQFDKRVLSDSSFQKYAAKELLVLKADFPQRKKLSPEVIKQNEQLADKYNAAGVFPFAILLNPDQSVISSLDIASKTAGEFIALIKTALKKATYPRQFRATGMLMHSPYEFAIVHTNNDSAWQLIRESIAEVNRIERLISEWSDTTQVGQLNLLAGKEPMKVNCELYQLLERSIEISKITQGAFDVSFLGAGKLWKFDGSMKTLPDSALVKKAIENVGYQNIQLHDSCTVFLSKPGMRIGFGGNGQGYAVDCVMKLLKTAGVQSALLNMSGDIYAWGKQPDGTPWKVGIANPANTEEMLVWLPVDGVGVTTTGNYEKFAEINGVRYAHIINPRTGYPATGVKSVSIISPSTELSDEFDTGVFVMGLEAGMHLIEQLPNINCIIVDDKNQVHYSKGLEVKFPNLPGNN